MADLTERRSYTRDEISTILRRAAELQGSVSEKPGAGLTLEELQQLAREADIDPSFVEAAAYELARGDDPAARTFMGGPLNLTLKRRVAGRVSDEAFARMVTAARRKFDQSGQTSAVGRTREWSAGAPNVGSYSFSLTERDDSTEIEVFWSAEIIAAPFIVVPLVLSLISLGLVFGAAEAGWMGVPIYLVILTLLATLSRTLFATVASRSRRGVAAFADRLATIAGSPEWAEEKTPQDVLAPAASQSTLPSVEEPQHVGTPGGPGGLVVLGPLVDDEPEVLPEQEAPRKQRIS